MKNLNKKIGVVALSGLMVLGGGFALGKQPVAHANQKKLSVEAKEDRLNSIIRFGNKFGYLFYGSNFNEEYYDYIFKIFNKGDMKVLDYSESEYAMIDFMNDLRYNKIEKKSGEMYKVKIQDLEAIIQFK